MTKGSATKVLRAGQVIGATAIYEGGEVVVDAAGLIQCVGCDCAATPGYAGATTVNCAGGVVSPSFINTHDHITYAQLAPIAHAQRYDTRNQWRKGLDGKTKLNTPANSAKESVSWGELRFVLAGATATAGSGSASGLLRNVDVANAQEGLGLNPAADFDTFPLYDSGATSFPTNACSYQDVIPQANVDKLKAYLPHVSEGVNAAAHNEFDCADGVAPSQVDLLKPQTAIIHAVGLNPADYAAMANDGTGLIWSPRSNIDLYGFTAAVTTAARAGVQIALGTDWTASGSMNILRELACADSYNQTSLGGFFSDYKLFKMVTSDAAALVASDDKIGSIKNGYFADLTIWDSKGKGAVDAVIRGKEADLSLVMRAGLVLTGEGDLVDALDPTGGAKCEVLDVCGSSKKVCAERETGLTIAAMRAAIESKPNLLNIPDKKVYDLFFCG
ncbi:MAG: hypothetical protein EOO74_08990, partial [Myxococcales bacterium]